MLLAVQLLNLSFLFIGISNKGPVAKVWITAKGAVPEAELRSHVLEAQCAVDAILERPLTLGNELEINIRRERLRDKEAVPHTVVRYWFL